MLLVKTFEVADADTSTDNLKNKEKNTHVERLEALTATIPTVRVITDADRKAFLEDDGGY